MQRVVRHQAMLDSRPRALLHSVCGVACVRRSHTVRSPARTSTVPRTGWGAASAGSDDSAPDSSPAEAAAAAAVGGGRSTSAPMAFGTGTGVIACVFEMRGVSTAAAATAVAAGEESETEAEAAASAGAATDIAAVVDATSSTESAPAAGTVDIAVAVAAGAGAGDSVDAAAVAAGAGICAPPGAGVHVGRGCSGGGTSDGDDAWANGTSCPPSHDGAGVGVEPAPVVVAGPASGRGSAGVNAPARAAGASIVSDKASETTATESGADAPISGAGRSSVMRGVKTSEDEAFGAGGPPPLEAAAAAGAGRFGAAAAAATAGGASAGGLGGSVVRSIVGAPAAPTTAGKGARDTRDLSSVSIFGPAAAGVRASARAASREWRSFEAAA
eukprot:SAG11_NODE_310_length_10927_cov_19.887514_5_plen_386_part_00